MKCYHCDTENLEGAQFCKKCGRRLDGMSLCTACGKMTPADGEYCTAAEISFHLFLLLLIHN